VVRVFDKIFLFTIDVIPSQGRSYEQAMSVVRHGDVARLIYKMYLPEGWTPSDTDAWVKRLPLSVKLLYGDKIRRRLNQTMGVVRDAKLEGLDITKYSVEMNNRVEPLTRNVNWHEKLVTNPIMRSIAWKYGLMLMCFVVHYG
jgi:hypothetical protein